MEGEEVRSGVNKIHLHLCLVKCLEKILLLPSFPPNYLSGNAREENLREMAGRKAKWRDGKVGAGSTMEDACMQDEMKDER